MEVRTPCGSQCVLALCALGFEPRLSGLAAISLNQLSHVASPLGSFELIMLLDVELWVWHLFRGLEIHLLLS
ncbi:rCG63269 [Rattus norvegicus]|uniref:RCG63269 n=1 Tax=Rattus norvegicus TaxID=10116 RepID=A6JGE2_RAT|nr:rCG63269 [Rattus norvegicus]